MAGVAEIVTELTGRPVRRVIVPDGQYRDALMSQGAPPAAADLLLGMFRASREAEFAAVDPTLPRLLGRPPVTVRDVLSGALPARA